MTTTKIETADIVEWLRGKESTTWGMTRLGEAANEIERLRKVNVMQARWLHAAHEEHKLFKDKVRQLLSVESAALKDGE